MAYSKYKIFVQPTKERESKHLSFSCGYLAMGHIQNVGNNNNVVLWLFLSTVINVNWV